MPKWTQGGWYTRTSLAGPAPPIHAGMTAGYDLSWHCVFILSVLFREKKRKNMPSARLESRATSTVHHGAVNIAVHPVVKGDLT